MPKNRYIFLLLIVIGSASFIAGCDLLGLGDDENENPKLTLLWQKDQTSTMLSISAPVIDNNSVYLLGAGLQKLDLQTGVRAWRSFIGDPIKFNFATKTLLEVDEALIINQGDKTYAFSKTDGSLLWEVTTPIAKPGVHNGDTLRAGSNPMAQSASHIFVGGEREVVGIVNKSGIINMNIKLDLPVPEESIQRVTQLTVRNSPQPILYIATLSGTEEPLAVTGKSTLTALSMETGNTIWTLQMEEIQDETQFIMPSVTALMVADNLLVVLTTDGIMALDPTTGTLQWHTTIGETLFFNGSRVLMTEDAIFVGNSWGSVARLNSSNGAIVWQRSFEVDTDIDPLTSVVPIIVNQGMVVDRGRLFYANRGSSDGGIWVLDSQDGTTQYHFNGAKLDFGLFGSIAVQDSILAVQTSQGTYGFRLP